MSVGFKIVGRNIKGFMQIIPTDGHRLILNTSLYV
jgi:hypothetical protein